MDKKTAILTLTERIRKDNRPQVVANQMYKERLIKNAFAYYQVGNAARIKASCLDKGYGENYSIDNKVEPKANYVFIENVDQEDYVIISSFAIIGEEEANLLKQTFYKDVPKNLDLAMESFGIKTCTALYEHYSSGSLECLLDEYVFYLKFKNAPSHLFYAQSQCAQKEFEDYFGDDIPKINKKLELMRVQQLYIAWDYHKVNLSEMQNIILGIENSPLFKGDLASLPEFFNLVFTIPYGDQNVEMNKKLLRMFSDCFDCSSIMIKEYSNGKHFQDYWSCLSQEKQTKVVEQLKEIKERNLNIDSFLYGQGFKDVDLDYMKIYKEDAKGFIKYFPDKSIEEQKVILKDIMGCNVTNEEVVEWLNENYSDLIREVGLSDG